MTAAVAAGGRRWKCGVCSAKAGDLVCGGCVTREAERRRVKRAERLDSLRNTREAAAVSLQERGVAAQQEARLQKEVADESRVKDQIREVTTRVAGERIKVASAAFALKHHRDLLAAAESHLSREQTSAVDLKEALLDGLRRHTEDAERTLRQRRWRKVVQLFVLLPVEPSIPPLMRVRTAAARSSGKGGGGSGSFQASTSSTTAASASEESAAMVGGLGEGGGSRRGDGLPAEPGSAGAAATAAAVGTGGKGGQVVSGVSTLVDLPLPNNGDYSQVPADVLMASLALLARLVVGVASCLGVSLPHPLFPTASTRYATISVDSSPRERSSQYPLCPLSKLAEIGVMGSASSVCNTMGAFDTALDLLRNDVVHLCVEGAKVPVDSLWPAEALLLNLWELQQHAMSELQSLSPMVDLPLPMPRDLPEASEGSYRHTAGGGRGGGGKGRRGGGSASGSGGDRASSPSTSSSYGQDGHRRGRARGMRSRLGFGLGLSSAAMPSPAPLPAAETEGGGREDDYEFVVGCDDGGGDVSGGCGGVGEEDRRRVEDGDPATGRGWSSWGSRLAAAGSGGGGLG